MLLLATPPREHHHLLSGYGPCSRELGGGGGVGGIEHRRSLSQLQPEDYLDLAGIEELTSGALGLGGGGGGSDRSGSGCIGKGWGGGITISAPSPSPSHASSVVEPGSYHDLLVHGRRSGGDGVTGQARRPVDPRAAGGEPDAEAGRRQEASQEKPLEREHEHPGHDAPDPQRDLGRVPPGGIVGQGVRDHGHQGADQPVGHVGQDAPARPAPAAKKVGADRGPAVRKRAGKKRKDHKGEWKWVDCSVAQVDRTDAGGPDAVDRGLLEEPPVVSHQELDQGRDEERAPRHQRKEVQEQHAEHRALHHAPEHEPQEVDQHKGQVPIGIEPEGEVPICYRPSYKRRRDQAAERRREAEQAAEAEGYGTGCAHHGALPAFDGSWASRLAERARRMASCAAARPPEVSGFFVVPTIDEIPEDIARRIEEDRIAALAREAPEPTHATIPLANGGGGGSGETRGDGTPEGSCTGVDDGRSSSGGSGGEGVGKAGGIRGGLGDKVMIVGPRGPVRIISPLDIPAPIQVSAAQFHGRPTVVRRADGAEILETFDDTYPAESLFAPKKDEPRDIYVDLLSGRKEARAASYREQRETPCGPPIHRDGGPHVSPLRRETPTPSPLTRKPAASSTDRIAPRLPPPQRLPEPRIRVVGTGIVDFTMDMRGMRSDSSDGSSGDDDHDSSDTDRSSDRDDDDDEDEDPCAAPARRVVYKLIPPPKFIPHVDPGSIKGLRTGPLKYSPAPCVIHGSVLEDDQDDRRKGFDRFAGNNRHTIPTTGKWPLAGGIIPPLVATAGGTGGLGKRPPNVPGARAGPRMGDVSAKAGGDSALSPAAPCVTQPCSVSCAGFKRPPDVLFLGGRNKKRIRTPPSCRLTDAVPVTYKPLVPIPTPVDFPLSPPASPISPSRSETDAEEAVRRELERRSAQAVKELYASLMRVCPLTNGSRKPPSERFPDRPAGAGRYYRCPLRDCRVKTYHPDLYMFHVVSHAMDCVYRCTVCELEFSSRRHAIRHCSRNHEGPAANYVSGITRLVPQSSLSDIIVSEKPGAGCLVEMGNRMYHPDIQKALSM